MMRTKEWGEFWIREAVKLLRESPMGEPEEGLSDEWKAAAGLEENFPEAFQPKPAKAEGASE